MSGLTRSRQWLDKRPYVLAALISLILIIWMLSGGEQHTETQATEEPVTEITPKVKVQRFSAELVDNTVELYGRTEPDRVTTIKAEVAGKILNVHAQRGAFVKQGQVIATIDMNDLKSRLAQAKALLAQRELNYQGVQSLQKEGYQGRLQLSTAEAELADVKAQIAALEIAIDNTQVTAPFDGVLNTRYVEQGDYVKVGDQIAMLADLQPIVVTGYATEHQISQLMVGQSANIELLNHPAAQGKIRYIASVADQKTNTFKVEVAVDNSQGQWRAGQSGTLQIALNKTPAIKVSPALLALDEQGNIGIKTVENEHVVFSEINIVKSESDGIWLSGLGENADIIVLGQGFVRGGDKVDPVMAESE
ncbi:efflux RND transporter periplasmic adaptor subunit [Thalassotalea sp. LPB0316]|uniref:efflux RND transporter periplasmic adaptor subunit n=1 Tax=Thalassotalea sp. LPB0316 TaxID=2769490 RepID=UPI0018668099|nr:efflux RND transporter periplasmic adaptor subunit [Thalassotalea sp. LPB0316]QOL26726.1 efflux RND transporter periplasmic adaptor subunit [Thalassotalea sp. LPB0316]